MGSRRFIFADEMPEPQPARFWLVRLVITGMIAGGFSAWYLMGSMRAPSLFG